MAKRVVTHQSALEWRFETTFRPAATPHWRLVQRRDDDAWSLLHLKSFLQLERCQDQPLTIFWNGWILPHHDQAVGLACAKSAQWRKADFEGYLSSYVDLAKHEMNFPELSSLSLHMCDDLECGKLHTIIPESIRDAKKLRHLTLSGDSQGCRFLSALPWSQITHFTAERLDDRSWSRLPVRFSLYYVLPLMLNMQYCSLEVCEEWNPFE
ncbi:hypothetical protein PM082_014632 [Marasmius tenuissimus]|nr:hypothetical protein PM082_014632 [Marasmius tenuissimus]